MNDNGPAQAVRRWSRLALLVAVAALMTVGSDVGAGQEAFETGQNVMPAYEGWEQNPDGSFNLVFGYMNRNWSEELNIPVGAENKVEPGQPDQGQPTRFLPRRNRFIFKVRVPADFGDKEVVWSLTSLGRTERAYGTLKIDYFMNNMVIMANNGGAGGAGGGGTVLGSNQSPTLRVDGATTRTVKVGQPTSLVAEASDDGIPEPRSLPPVDPRRGGQITVDSATGLRLSWFVYRGAGPVIFDPPQIKVWEDTRPWQNSPWSPGWKTPPPAADGRWTVRATFGESGRYVLRCLAHDGGLMTHQNLTFIVTD